MTEYNVTLVGGPPWGFRINSSDEGTLISQLNADGRAQQEGVHIGDFILKINGKSVSSGNYSEAQRHLRKAAGILRLNLKKGTGIPHVQSEPHGLNKKQTVVLHQPGYSFDVKEQVPGKSSIAKDVGLMVDLAKHKLFPQTAPKPFNVISLPNQTGYMSDTDMHSMRSSRWNPFTSGSLGSSGATRGRGEAPVLCSAAVVKTGRPLPPIKRSGRDSVDSTLGPSYMYSAPVTPLGPLSPCPSNMSDSSKDAKYGLVDASELSISRQSLASSAATEMDNFMKEDDGRDGRQLNICTSPVPSSTRQTPPLAITIATAVKRASFRMRGRSNSITKGLPAVHENLPMKDSSSTTPTLTEVEEDSRDKREGATESKNSSMADSALGISPNQEYPLFPKPNVRCIAESMLRSTLTDKSTSTSVWTASQMSDSATSPIAALDAVRPLSAVSAVSNFSDHPSLASGTIDMDPELQSRSTTTDLDAIFENELDASGGTQYDISSSFTLDSPTMPLPCTKNKHNSLKKPTPKSTNFCEFNMDRSLKDEIANMTQALADLNNVDDELPDYPKAFAEKRVDEDTDTPKPFSTSSKRKASEPPSHSVSTTVQMNNTQQGRWQPYTGSGGSNASSSIPATSPIPGYNRINFYSPLDASNTQNNEAFSFSSQSTAKANMQPLHQTPPIPPTPPLSLSSVALPVPPPPPPPTSSTTPSWKHKTEESNEPILPDHERCTIEYPEKQSVAALKHAIEYKLNGSAPVKGVPPMVDIASDSGIGTPTSSTAPPIPPTPPLPPKSSLRYDAPPPPLQIAHAQPQSPSLSHPQSPAAPPRPPLPSQLISPPLPVVPPSPSRPVTYTAPSFEPYRGGSVPVSRPERSPPRGAVLMERKSSVEGNQVRTDSYYAIPHKETHSQRRAINQSDYSGRSGTPNLGGKQPPMLAADHGDYQHHWYKMMYRKLHQIDKDEDQSVLRYRMRDYRTPPRDQRQNAAHLYGKAFNEPEREVFSSKMDAPAYKYEVDTRYAPDQPPGLDYQPGWWPQGYASTNSIPASRRSVGRYEHSAPSHESSRSMRSKSAGRYESGSPLPSEVVKGTPANEQKYYKIQPKRIDQYTPGESSLARFEAEERPRPASAVPFNQTPNLPSGFVPSSWRRERDRFKNDSARQRSNSATGRGGYGALGSSSRYYYGMEDERAPSVGRSRHDMSPPNRDQVRDWYRSIQHGGDVPYAGLRQPAPERRDSYMRAILYLLRERHNKSDTCTKRESRVTCEQEAQTSAYSDSEYHPITIGTSHAKGTGIIDKARTNFFAQSNSKLKCPVKLENYATYFKQIMQSSSSTYGVKHYSSPNTNASILKSRPVTPPILCSNPSTTLYAVQRSKVNDFHIPSYRSSPERQQPHSPRDRTKTPGDELKWEEIEAFFDYLNRDDKSTWTNGSGNGHGHRSSLASNWWEKELEDYLKTQAKLRKQRDDEYLTAWKELNTILQDIELMTPESVKGLKLESRGEKENIMQKSSSFPEGLSNRILETRVNASSPVTESGYIAPERSGLKDRSFCFPRLMRQFECFEQSKFVFDTKDLGPSFIGSKLGLTCPNPSAITNLKHMTAMSNSSSKHTKTAPVTLNGHSRNQFVINYKPTSSTSGVVENSYDKNERVAPPNESAPLQHAVSLVPSAVHYGSLPELVEECSVQNVNDMCRSRSAAGFFESQENNSRTLTADLCPNQLPTTLTPQHGPRSKTMVVDYSTTAQTTTHSRLNTLFRSNSLSDLNNFTLSPGATRAQTEPDSKESWTLPRFMLPTRPTVTKSLSKSFSDLSLPDQTAQSALARYQYRKLRERASNYNGGFTNQSSDWKSNQGDYLSPHPKTEFTSNSITSSAFTSPSPSINTPLEPRSNAKFDSKCLNELKRSLSAPEGFLIQRTKSNRTTPQKMSNVRGTSEGAEIKGFDTPEGRFYYDWFTNATTNQLLLTLLELLGQTNIHKEDAHEYTPSAAMQSSPNAYPNTHIMDESPYRTYDRFKPPMEFGTFYSNGSRAEQVIEDERRKRQEREVWDQRSRRHGYTPLPSHSPGISGDRYQSLVENHGVGSSAQQDILGGGVSPAPTSDDLRGVAKAIYAFSAHNMKELSFKKGDLMRIRRIVDPNWYEGEIRGVVGLVPVSYVELAAVAEDNKGLSYTEVFHVEEGQAQALYNFDGRNLNELPMRKGDIVTIIKRIDSNWLEGKSNEGRVGIFPTSYVRVIKEPATLRKDFSAPFGNGKGEGRRTPKRDDADSSSRLLVNGLPHDSSSRTQPQTQPFPDDVLNASSTSSRPLPKSGSHGLDVAAWELRHTASRLAGDKPRMPQNADTYQSLFNYRPQNADELELREGDIVYVVEKCDDGWFIGTSLRTGLFGTFPGNYVQLMR